MCEDKEAHDPDCRQGGDTWCCDICRRLAVAANPMVELPAVGGWPGGPWETP
jgi:hypothetical protein